MISRCPQRWASPSTPNPSTARWDAPFNPVRPLPPVGGLPRLHGIEPDEVDVSLPLGERVGHSLVLGTTRVGKTRLAELFVTQDTVAIGAVLLVIGIWLLTEATGIL